MSGATILPFEDAMRQSVPGRSRLITDAQLRRQQRTVALGRCHAAFDSMSFEFKTKARRFSVFQNLSVAFPKGRKIVVLGHKGSGKSVMFELLTRERSPTRGRVVINSRLSWPIHATRFLDPKLSVRENVKFIAHVMGVDAFLLVDSVQKFCELSSKRLDENSQGLSQPIRRRVGAVIALAAQFDCLLFDMPLKAQLYGLKGAKGDRFEELILGHDYICAIPHPKHVPFNCDLAYILYDGRLYQFEDVLQAVSIFDELPEPAAPGLQRKGAEEENEDDDDEFRDGFF